MQVLIWTLNLIGDVVGLTYNLLLWKLWKKQFSYEQIRPLYLKILHNSMLIPPNGTDVQLCKCPKSRFGAWGWMLMLKHNNPSLQLLYFQMLHMPPYCQGLDWIWFWNHHSHLDDSKPSMLMIFVPSKLKLHVTEGHSIYVFKIRYMILFVSLYVT